MKIEDFQQRMQHAVLVADGDAVLALGVRPVPASVTADGGETHDPARLAIALAALL